MSDSSAGPWTCTSREIMLEYFQIIRECISKDVDIEHKYITSTHIKPCARKGRPSPLQRPGYVYQTKTPVSLTELHKQESQRGWGHTEMIERGWRKPALSLPAQPGHLLGLSNLNQVCITRHKLSLDTERTVLSETVWTKKAGSIKQINMFRVFDLFFVHALCVLSIITSIVNSLLCRSRRGKKRMSFGSTEDEL